MWYECIFVWLILAIKSSSLILKICKSVIEDFVKKIDKWLMGIEKMNVYTLSECIMKALYEKLYDNSVNIEKCDSTLP